MKKLLLILFTVSFVACDPTEEIFLRSYVMYYFDQAEMKVGEDYRTDGIVSVYMGFFGSSSLGNHESTGALKRSYDALCEKHGDMTFNRNFVIRGPGGPRSTICTGIDFVSIDIVSDADFDKGHPAQKSLGDIVSFNSYSLKQFINNGYEGAERNVVEGRVSELTSDDLILLGGSSTNVNHGYYMGRLTFDSPPTLSKTHTFTVTMTADDGRVFSDSIEITFD